MFDAKIVRYTSVIATIVYPSNEEVNLVDEWKSLPLSCKSPAPTAMSFADGLSRFFLVRDFNYRVSENIDLSAYKCQFIEFFETSCLLNFSNTEKKTDKKNTRIQCQDLSGWKLPWFSENQVHDFISQTQKKQHHGLDSWEGPSNNFSLALSVSPWKFQVDPTVG